MIARRTRIGAGENHIFHARTAHGFIRGLAHHPTQGFQQIGFAAAIRPDNAGHAGQNVEVNGFDERFEAGQAQTIKFHLLRPLITRHERFNDFFKRGERLIAL